MAEDDDILEEDVKGLSLQAYQFLLVAGGYRKHTEAPVEAPVLCANCYLARQNNADCKHLTIVDTERPSVI